MWAILALNLFPLVWAAICPITPRRTSLWGAYQRFGTTFQMPPGVLFWHPIRFHIDLLIASADCITTDCARLQTKKDCFASEIQIVRGISIHGQESFDLSRGRQLGVPHTAHVDFGSAWFPDDFSRMWS
jgi:hypothetical protein